MSDLVSRIKLFFGLAILSFVLIKFTPEGFQAFLYKFGWVTFVAVHGVLPAIIASTARYIYK